MCFTVQIQVVGKVGSVRDALVQIVLRLRDDVLKDRDRGHNQSAGADSYYSGGTGLSAHSVLPSVPPVAQWVMSREMKLGVAWACVLQAVSMDTGLYRYASVLPFVVMGVWFFVAFSFLFCGCRVFSNVIYGIFISCNNVSFSH